MLHDILCKVVMVGDSGVGKTNLLLRMTRDEFMDDSRTTIGVDFASVTINYEQARVKAAIWDTAGQERYRAMAPAMYRGARGALIVYDISSRASFENARLLWLRELRMQFGVEDLNIILVGNKSDLLHLRAVSTKEARSFAEEEGLMFMETSARDAVNVRQAFQMLLQEIYDRVLIQHMPLNENRYSTIGKTLNTTNILPHDASEKADGSSGCQC